jgi:hypothetical protein
VTSPGISSWRRGGVLAGLATSLVVVAGCGTPRLAGAPQPEADLSGQWVLESGDDAAKLITAALPAPRKPRPERTDADMMPMPREGGDNGASRGGGRSGGRGGGRSGGRGDDQAQQRPAADPAPVWGRLSPREFVAAFVMPPTRLDVAQQPALVRVGAGDRPRAFEPGDEEPVTVSDRYGSRAVRAGWAADAFVINSEDGRRLHVVEQLRRSRDGRLERTVDFSAAMVKSLKVHSVYRRATPAELDGSQFEGPPAPPVR